MTGKPRRWQWNPGKVRVLRAFPDARAVDSGRVYRVYLWPGCKVPVAEGRTSRQAYAAAAEIVERDMG